MKLKPLYLWNNDMDRLSSYKAQYGFWLSLLYTGEELLLVYVIVLKKNFIMNKGLIFLIVNRSFYNNIWDTTSLILLNIIKLFYV